MWNAGLVEAQAGIKNARKNINNLRYADVAAAITTLMGESKEGKELALCQRANAKCQAGWSTS